MVVTSVVDISTDFVGESNSNKANVADEKGPTPTKINRMGMTFLKGTF